MALNEGDCVRIISRSASNADMRNKTYYPFFGGLVGIVDKLYDSEVCVKVDCESLPDDILARHVSIQDSIRNKWLNGLSGEARNRLSANEKKFELAYTLIVQISDLEKIDPSEMGKSLSAHSVIDQANAEDVPAD